MIIPVFTFDEEMNGYACEPFAVEERCRVSIELASMAPVVILRQEADGGYANYGQSPRESDRYEIEITSKDAVQLVLATPVEVKCCFIL